MMYCQLSDKFTAIVGNYQENKFCAMKKTTFFHCTRVFSIPF